MSNWISIDPVSFGILGEATKISVTIGYHPALVNECALSYAVANEDEVILHQGSLKLEGDDYDAWGDDNMYLFQYVCTKQGFTISTK